jgi:hypothetical protein
MAFLSPYKHPLNIANHTPWAHLAFERRTANDEPQLVIVLRGAFSLAHEQPLEPLRTQPRLELSDVFHGDPKCTSIRREGVLATFKPASDVHLDACAWSPGGVPRQTWDAAVTVGARVKQLRVMGPRVWSHREGAWSLSEPEVCDRVPLVWERAFGGAHMIDGKRVAEDRNPLGTGYLPDGMDTSQPIAAPQIIAPDEPEHRPGTRYVPQGVSPLGRETSWRLSHAGTYDEAWQRDRWPCLPDDFNYSFYNSAHPDLVVDGYLHGDEPIELVNLTPGGLLRTALPGLAYVADVVRAGGGIACVTLALDTVHLDVASPDVAEHRALLTWRTCLPMIDPLAQVTVRAARVKNGGVRG